MKRRQASAAVALALTLAACAHAPTPETTAASEAYLSPEAVARLVSATPPPPAPDSAVAQADRAASDRYRALAGGDRWLLATAHAEVRPPLALQHFDCALGVRFGSAETPNLTRLMNRLLHEADTVAERVKAAGFRARPVGDDHSRIPCQTVSDAGRASASYPSGSATVAAAYGEAFADLAPDRAAAVRATAHQIALSRAICGMHYPSDVAAGETLGLALMAEVRDGSGYRADLAAAAPEVAAARAAGLTSPACAAERAAFAAPLP